MLMWEGKKHFACSLFSQEIISLVILEGELCRPAKKKAKVIQSYQSEKWVFCKLYFLEDTPHFNINELN